MAEGSHDEGAPGAERAQRLAKVDELRGSGVDPYPVRFDRDLTLGELRELFGQLPADSDPGERVRIAGRLMLIRRQGGLSFGELRDRSGHVQLFVDTHVVGADKHHSFDHLDRGDIVGVEGTVMTTHTGELSVKIETFQLLSKGIRPLPEKGHPLTDLETRYRQRYVDLIVNENTQRIFEIRIKAIDAIRQHLREQGFWEVETPVLQSIQGGATARPFITHHNALDIDQYLRIALELHLKRLIVGGMERVFEMSRVFRNEGIDHRHNPEFTEIEVYQAYADYTEMMDLTEALFRVSAQAALGTTIVTVKGQQVDLAQPFRRTTMVELIKEKVGVDINPAMDVDEARKVLDGLGVPYERDWGAGKMTDELYDKFVEAQLIKPTFSLDHPREVSPLARTHRSDPTLVERFELVIGGVEFANAYSELNDPVDQLERFQIEARNKAAGDVEAGDVDLDYVRALEYAMPPTGGLGVGVDRLVMLLAGVESIREIILFPTLRPEAGEGPTRGPAPRHRHVPDDHASGVAAVKEAAAAAPDGAAEPVVAEAAGRKPRPP